MAEAALSTDGTLTWMCPACQSGHGVPIDRWTWNGSLDKPTLSPSVRVSWNYGDPPKEHCCHFIMTDGNIAFCGDCTHAMAGQTVPMEDF
jgi:hypothetical protein